MGHFPGKRPQSTNTASNYQLFASAEITPAVGNYLIGTTAPNVGSFIPTEVFAYVSNGPPTAVGLNLAINFSVGFIGPTYNEFVVANVTPTAGFMLGGDGTNPENANNFINKKFRQFKLVASSASGAGTQGLGTPRNAATPIYVRITQIQGTATTQTVRFILGGIYTGLK